MLFRLEAIRGSSGPRRFWRIEKAVLNGIRAFAGLFMSRSMRPERSIALANARLLLSGKTSSAISTKDLATS